MKCNEMSWKHVLNTRTENSPVPLNTLQIFTQVTIDFHTSYYAVHACDVNGMSFTYVGFSLRGFYVNVNMKDRVGGLRLT